MKETIFENVGSKMALRLSFFRIPKLLVTGEDFRNISIDAKLLYGVLLDRMELSAKNGWQDDLSRIYIICTLEEIREMLSCSQPKAVKMLKELEEDCRLIERKRVGLNQPNRIYVKDFVKKNYRLSMAGECFDYFYAGEEERYTFYRIPKVLISRKEFQKISTDAKLLYGIILDRTALSVENDWVDESGNVYIIMPLEEVQSALGCSKNTATKLLDELENDCGLIERRRQGLNRPSVIFVRDFIPQAPQKKGRKKRAAAEKPREDSANLPSELPDSQNIDFRIPKNLTSGFPKNELPDSQNINFRIPKNLTSGFQKNELPDSQNIDFQIPKNLTSGFPKIELPDSQNFNSNNTDISNTDISNTDISNTDINNTDISYPIHPINYREQENISAGKNRDMKRDDYKKIIKENIGYNSLVKRCSTEELEEISVEELDGIVDLIVDVLTSEAEYMLVAGGTRPVADVKERFLSLNETHMAYVLGSLNKNNTHIRNVRKYLLATLFNAPATCGPARLCAYQAPGSRMGRAEREAIRRIMQGH